MAGQDHSTGTCDLTSLEMRALTAIDRCPRCAKLPEPQKAERLRDVLADVNKTQSRALAA